MRNEILYFVFKLLELLLLLEMLEIIDIQKTLYSSDLIKDNPLLKMSIPYSW